MTKTPDKPHVLILGGTADARRLASFFAEHFGPAIRLTTSLAGRTKDFRAIAGDVRSGGFGGPDGLAEYLDSDNVTFLIDATHPFAATISAHAAEAADQKNVKRLSIFRARWELPPSLDVTRVASMEEAAMALHAMKSERALITIGVRNLEALTAATGTSFLIRLIEPPENPIPLQNARIITQRPPFSIETELTLMTDNRIDALVSKESGGEATGAKLLAADKLGIRVILIERPAPPAGETVATPEEALVWLRQKIG